MTILCIIVVHALYLLSNIKVVRWKYQIYIKRSKKDHNGNVLECASLGKGPIPRFMYTAHRVAPEKLKLSTYNGNCSLCKQHLFSL
jgi:hypothetical protein